MMFWSTREEIRATFISYGLSMGIYIYIYIPDKLDGTRC